MNLAPDVGFSEIIVIAVVALVVIGPKDLPRVMQFFGRMTAQARRLAGEFQSAFNQMAREAEMEEMRREIEALKRDNPFKEARDAVTESVRPVEAAIVAETARLDEAYHQRDGASSSAAPGLAEPATALPATTAPDEAPSAKVV